MRRAIARARRFVRTMMQKAVLRQYAPQLPDRLIFVWKSERVVVAKALGGLSRIA
jgi:hypothetical protein